MAENKIQRWQITDGNPVDNLYVYAQEIPSDTMRVSSGAIVLSDNSTVTFFPAVAASQPIAPVSAGCRWDLVCIDLATGLLKTSTDNGVLAGVEVPVGTQWYDGFLPALPPNYFPLAAVLIDEVSPSTPEISQSDIIDLRGFFHKIG